jgi:methionyl-tRNA synthetase
MDTKPEITFDDFLKLDLRVATIEQAEPHPNADRLLKLQIDLGPLGRRQICAGIRPYCDPEQLLGRQIAVVANLAPRRIRGEESNGMLLAASVTESQGDGEEAKDVLTDVILLSPGRPAPAGAAIS